MTSSRPIDNRFSVAPMMAWTDRHCRAFLRRITRHTLLYTEMVTADAVIHGDRARLIGFDGTEHPVALQLGGSDPVKLAEAARIGAEFGYDEINLNVGCPSERVQSGCFGAALMAEPDRVGRCVDAMRAASPAPVTVKCRIGIDDDVPEDVLPEFVRRVAAGGCETFIIHARKAWLKGLSPAKNREVPPLDYGLVHALKADNPALTIILNGGVPDLDAAEEHLTQVDGVMMGRAAYKTPWVLAGADRRFFGAPPLTTSQGDVVRAMVPYIEARLSEGVPLHAITRHMLGLYQGQPGAKNWRRHLASAAVKPGAGREVLLEALELVEDAHRARAA